MHVVLVRYCYRKSSVRPSVCLRPYITYTGTARRSRFQVQVFDLFGLWQLATNTAAAGSEVRD